MGNASRETELKKQERKERDLRKQQLNDLRTVLSNASGKRLLWRVLEKCGTFESVFHDGGAKMAYLSGQQDLGHFLMSEIIEADENLFVKMMKENKAKEQV